MQKILIVGGGTAGITVAAQLLKANSKLEVSIVEPNDKHYYQPLWTLVGGGIFPRERSQRKESDFIPRGAKWIRDSVESFDPENRSLRIRGGETIDYDFLVVCPGLQINWSAIGGLSKDIVGSHDICSNYSYETVNSTWQTLQRFRGGRALFTHPSGAVKCAGAPQKICYLAEDYFRRQGIRDKSEVVFAAALPRIFAVDKYASSLEAMIERKRIETHMLHDLVELRPESKQAVFQILETDQQVIMDYDMIHVTPKMGAPDFVAQSPLADEAGWADVDKHSTQHVRFPNIFSLGDCSNLPTSKTAAAIRKQAPVTVANILALINGRPMAAEYDGYTSCPLVTSYKSMVLAEFDYDKNPQETFPFDQSRERFSMFLLKKYGLPFFYWHRMLRGRA